MSVNVKPLEELVQELSPALQAEVRDFVEFLLIKHQPTGRRLRQDWAGALQSHRGKFTSVELQHKVLDWRTE